MDTWFNQTLFLLVIKQTGDVEYCFWLLTWSELIDDLLWGFQLSSPLPIEKFMLWKWIVVVLLSEIPRITDVALKSRRQLMTIEVPDSILYPPLSVTNGTETCILMYASNFSITANKSVHVDLTNSTFVSRNVDFSSSACSAANTTWVELGVPYHEMHAILNAN